MKIPLQTSRAGWGLILSALIVLVLGTPAWSLDDTLPGLALISPQSMNAKRQGLVILDARPARVFQESHIPGARSMSWEDYTGVDGQGIPYRMFAPERMADLLGAMGIDENTPLAIYGDADSSWGGEGWLCWLFSFLGHRADILVLDGGIQAWIAQALPLTTETSATPTPRGYHVQPRYALDMTTQDLSTASGIQIVDTRSFIERLQGSIPGSIPMAWTGLYTGDTRRPLSPESFRQFLIKHSINPERPVVYYCTGGIRSGYAWMVHRLAGLPVAKNYEGGMEAWNRARP